MPMRRLYALLPLLAVLAGCPVTQSQQTPVAATRVKEVSTGSGYWLYVPSTYDAQRDWPLVITLHGTYGFDDSEAQIREWKYLAERHGLIVAAPDLRSVQGILPVVRSQWYKDLATDEKTILAVMEDISRHYKVDPNAVLLTGFSAGGFPMYYTGLRNPTRFNMLVARACNSDVEMLSKIELTDAARKLPIAIFWGKDDLKKIHDDSWAAFRYLREHKCLKAEQKQIPGGHLRRPDVTYGLWIKHLPTKYRS